MLSSLVDSGFLVGAGSVIKKEVSKVKPTLRGILLPTSCEANTLLIHRSLQTLGQEFQLCTPEGDILPVLLAKRHLCYLVDLCRTSCYAFIQVELCDLYGHDTNCEMLHHGYLQCLDGGTN